MDFHCLPTAMLGLLARRSIDHAAVSEDSSFSQLSVDRLMLGLAIFVDTIRSVKQASRHALKVVDECTLA